MGEGRRVPCRPPEFKTSRVGVYKCLSLIVSFTVTVAIWPREVVSCRDFILRAVGPCRLSEFTLAGPLYRDLGLLAPCLHFYLFYHLHLSHIKYCK